MVARFVIPAVLLGRNPIFTFLAASKLWIPANPHDRAVTTKDEKT
jgi:hypothetical protein